ncbi:MAG: hypothetical protein ACRD88_14180 [Terriglobia bacterium]
MKHRKQELKSLLLVATGVFFASSLFGQSGGQSMADLARRTRAQKSGGSPRVFTNENVARSAPTPAPAPAARTTPAPPAAGAAGAARPAGQAPAGAAGQPAAQGQAQQGAAQPAAGAQPAQPAEKTPEELEKEYRAKFAELRENLSLEERKLDILQRELNLMQNQYYSDPQATLLQETTRGNINTRVQEIETQKAAVDKAKQAVAALEEELRVKGLPPGWAR